jgi:di/tricarboxylate transporter
MNYIEFLERPVDYPSCPCRGHRLLEDEEAEDGKTWEIVYTSVVIVLMFAALASDRLGADSIILAALTALMAAQVITVKEGFQGFANEGVLTVLALFVVAEGITKTGALDWYIGKVLGSPTNASSAQLRILAPVTLASAFLNNTPIVVVMIPIIQKWARNIHIPVQQLMIPLSFASILGGTCTLIGTSTNLVVVGLLEERYPNDPDVSIGLFDIGLYGVPVALVGMAYILFASPYLLPGGGGQSQDALNSLEKNEEILLGARLTSWSPAVSRTVKRSGLRDTGGIYLVSVVRAATGHVHRAVSHDFVLNVGDVLYFTGLVESFGEFCEEHELELLTVDHDFHETSIDGTVLTLPEKKQVNWESSDDQDCDLTKRSVVTRFSEEGESHRLINRMTDIIRGAESGEEGTYAIHESRFIDDPAKIVVTIDKALVVVGIDVQDRPGLMVDISKGLLRLNLELHHTEAAVIKGRSLSIWRCEVIGPQIHDQEQIWSGIESILATWSGISALKHRGLRVIRTRVVKGSRLVGHTGAEVDFRQTYEAGIVALQKKGKNAEIPLSRVRFEVGDILVLQANDASPLLKIPPAEFYMYLSEGSGTDESIPRTSSVRSMVNMVTRRKASTDVTPELASARKVIDNSHLAHHGDEEDPAVVDLPELVQQIEEQEAVWKDLQLLLPDEGIHSGDGAAREFLTAMQVAPKSKLSGKTVAKSGIDRLPALFLVSIERPIPAGTSLPTKNKRLSVMSGASDAHSLGEDSNQRLGSIQTDNQAYQSIAPEEPLQHGDVLWFSGSASSVGDLRKIPGLISYQNDEVEKINEKVHDRRLVQAVIARKGPLVGKTVKEVQFRKRYGAAVIAVHREGKRVHEHPGNVKLQAGDVLLLEAGPSFIAKSGENDRSFALLAEVEDSAPPRLSLLIPALLITAGMLIVFMADWTSLLVSALVASMLMVALGILSEQEARDAVNWDVFITIAAAFGIGTALVNSGVAGGIANFLVDVGTALGIGSAGLLGAVYFATFLISNVVTNNAAAALLFPIALDAAEQTGTDRVLMSYALMLGASASFMSPYGYTTNLLIYGPGGYKYKDFLVFGTPMQIVLWVASIAFLAIIEPWYISWIASSVFLGLAIALRSLKASFTGLCCSSRIEDGTETGKKSVIG